MFYLLFGNFAIQNVHLKFCCKKKINVKQIHVMLFLFSENFIINSCKKLNQLNGELSFNNSDEIEFVRVFTHL